jgi:large subunit ribosomal protein L6
MSRIGKLPVEIPKGVTIDLKPGNIVVVKGPKGELEQKVNPNITIKIEDNQLLVTRPNDSKPNKSMHGLYRSLIANMVEGVSNGFTIKQELVGVGFRAETRGQQLILNLGYSHDIIFELPPEIKAEAKTEKRSNPVITLTSADKQLIGHVASKIRSFRKPEPYKGKGVKFVGEQIRRKAGKAASV